MLDLTAEKKLQKNALRCALRAISNLDFAPFHLWLGLGFLGKTFLPIFYKQFLKILAEAV